MVRDTHPSSNEYRNKMEMSFNVHGMHTHTHAISVLSDFLKFTITSLSISRSLLLHHHTIIVPFKVIINHIIASPAPTGATLKFLLSFFPLSPTANKAV